MMHTAVISLEAPPAASAGNPASDLIRIWAQACDRFLDWQRREILQTQPEPPKLSQHRDTLKWMLRLTRILHAEIADPDFPDSALKNRLAGKLLQLQESWSLIHGPADATQADAILKNLSPNESSTGSPA